MLHQRDAELLLHLHLSAHISISLSLHGSRRTLPSDQDTLYLFQRSPSHTISPSISHLASRALITDTPSAMHAPGYLRLWTMRYSLTAETTHFLSYFSRAFTVT